MQVLQWSMTIPKEKQKDFLTWFQNAASPILGGFGAKQHELYRVEDKQLVGRQLTEKDRFIEKIYFDDKFNIPDYFEAVKKDPKAWKISREYEKMIRLTLKITSFLKRISQ